MPTLQVVIGLMPGDVDSPSVAAEMRAVLTEMTLGDCRALTGLSDERHPSGRCPRCRRSLP
jgi:hypothetical protein